MDNMDVFTTVDKAKRDELYDELRKRGLPNERKVVKFSGVQAVLGEDGEQARYFVQYERVTGKLQTRFVWQSNFSVAYPRELKTVLTVQSGSRGGKS